MNQISHHSSSVIQGMAMLLVHHFDLDLEYFSEFWMNYHWIDHRGWIIAVWADHLTSFRQEVSLLNTLVYERLHWCRVLVITVGKWIASLWWHMNHHVLATNLVRRATHPSSTPTSAFSASLHKEQTTSWVGTFWFIMFCQSVKMRWKCFYGCCWHIGWHQSGKMW